MAIALACCTPCCSSKTSPGSCHTWPCSLILWGFIAGCIKEGAEVFIDNEGLIKQLPSALSVHVYRLVWKQFLFMCHNLVIWLALLAIFRIPVGWNVLLAIPAMFLLVINGIWVSMFFGIIATRFRDVLAVGLAGSVGFLYDAHRVPRPPSRSKAGLSQNGQNRRD